MYIMVTNDFGFGLKETTNIFNQQPFKCKPTAKTGCLKLTIVSITIFNTDDLSNSKKGEKENNKIRSH
jgi:hypothetical protein